ncbi:hypothetical protein C8R42DRAFT_357399 [Lentinula raphanica]|nr:hypothetical protein C8R42DRAFT_357399 [Lentinula raphanica]
MWKTQCRFHLATISGSWRSWAISCQIYSNIDSRSGWPMYENQPSAIWHAEYDWTLHGARLIYVPWRNQAAHRVITQKVGDR